MQPGTLLYAEDEPNDAFFLQLAFTRAGLPHVLKVVPDGDQAVDYLSGVGAFTDREQYPLPCLTLLDIKMPKRSGFEVLEWIRQQPEFKSLPVLMFTSSQHPADMEKARQFAADGYLLKPSSPLKLVELVKSLHECWLSRPKTSRL